jgi:hypothetical protein
MSFSFNVRAATESSVIAGVITKMDEVVASQPIHAGDRDQVLAAAEAFIALVPQNDELDYSVSVNGSTYQVDGVTRGASFGFNVGLISRET